MELVIGRDSGTSRLSITIDSSKKFTFGEANSVPRNVSREHCKISITNNAYKIDNINKNNITYVNGNQVESKNFNPQIDNITLGKGCYKLNLAAILQALKLNSPPTPPQTCSIKHLEKIWNTYHDTKLKYNIKQQKTMAIRSGSGLFSLAAIISGVIVEHGKESTQNDMQLNKILYVIAFAFGLFFVIKSYISASKNPIYLDKLDKEFRKDYVCPNHSCHKFMGYVPYEDIVKVGMCGLCKSKFTDK